jgi:hypothetical protein
MRRLVAGDAPRYSTSCCETFAPQVVGPRLERALSRLLHKCWPASIEPAAAKTIFECAFAFWREAVA